MTPMTPTLMLLAVIFGLLLSLEVLNALYDSVIEGLHADLARKEPAPLWLVLPMLLRSLLAVVAALGRAVSLWIHELAHALAQLVFGGKPRIVLLKNGGFAQARPWFEATPARIVYAIGGRLGLGVMCLAPILVGATLLVLTLVGTTALELRDLPGFGRTLSTVDAAHAREVTGATWTALAAAPWWAWPVGIVVSLLLAPSMTPSAVDYVHGRLHLLAYSLAAIVCTAIAARAPHALWFVAPIAAVAGVSGMLRGPEWLRAVLGGFGLSTAALALTLAVVAWRTEYTALGALHTALGMIVYGLGVAAMIYVVFAISFVALSLITIRPRTLWYALRVVPRNLINLVRRFHTCEPCQIHYHGTCDGCGRTPDAPAAVAPPT